MTMTEPKKPDASDSLNSLVRPFVMGELYAGCGGMKCESGDCENRTFAIWLTADENNGLPEDSGPRAALYILREKVGIALCDECRSNRGIDGKYPSINLLQSAKVES